MILIFFVSFLTIKFDFQSGTWRGGRLNGWGRMTLQSGEKFEGSWSDGKRDGVGFVVNPNGDWFEGVWRSDKRQGPGFVKIFIHTSFTLLTKGKSFCKSF